MIDRIFTVAVIQIALVCLLSYERKLLYIPAEFRASPVDLPKKDRRVIMRAEPIFARR